MPPYALAPVSVSAVEKRLRQPVLFAIPVKPLTVLKQNFVANANNPWWQAPNLRPVHLVGCLINQMRDFAAIVGSP